MLAWTRPFTPLSLPRSSRPREISLLRPSLRALTSARRGCAHCHRTPLIGEQIFFFGHAMVCELCRPLRRDAPARQERVHSPERDHTVKRAVR
jgi:hypothetical protein